MHACARLSSGPQPQQPPVEHGLVQVLWVELARAHVVDGPCSQGREGTEGQSGRAGQLVCMHAREHARQ